MDILQLIGKIACFIVFYLVMFGGVCLIPLGLPGQFLIVLAAFIGILIAGTELLSWWALVLVLSMAILAEIFEAIAGSLGAGTAKGSIWSVFGALAGGIGGAILGAFILPLIGSILGVLVGTFLGAYVVEYGRTRLAYGAAKVAKGALIGRILGSVIKMVVAMVMIIVITLVMI